jgi:hypothetical protein
VFWGFIAGLTHGFYQKRPWEGVWGAFNRSCNVVALFFLAFIPLVIGLMIYEKNVSGPRAEARGKEWYACLWEHYVEVGYDGSRNAHAPMFHPLCQDTDGSYGGEYRTGPGGYDEFVELNQDGSVRE